MKSVGGLSLIPNAKTLVRDAAPSRAYWIGSSEVRTRLHVKFGFGGPTWILSSGWHGSGTVGGGDQCVATTWSTLAPARLHSSSVELSPGASGFVLSTWDCVNSRNALKLIGMFLLLSWIKFACTSSIILSDLYRIYFYLSGTVGIGQINNKFITT